MLSRVAVGERADLLGHVHIAGASVEGHAGWFPFAVRRAKREELECGQCVGGEVKEMKTA